MSEIEKLVEAFESAVCQGNHSPRPDCTCFYCTGAHVAKSALLAAFEELESRRIGLSDELGDVKGENNWLKKRNKWLNDKAEEVQRENERLRSFLAEGRLHLRETQPLEADLKRRIGKVLENKFSCDQGPWKDEKGARRG